MNNMKFKRYDNSERVSLLECPFCGGVPKVKHIGNYHTKKRKIEIRCPECRCTRTDAALTHTFEWLENAAAKNWNQRPNKKIKGA